MAPAFRQPADVYPFGTFGAVHKLSAERTPVEEAEKRWRKFYGALKRFDAEWKVRGGGRLPMVSDVVEAAANVAKGWTPPPRMVSSPELRRRARAVVEAMRALHSSITKAARS